MPTEKPVTETIQAEHRFDGAEQQQLAKTLVARMQEYTSLENQLDSIKQDFKSRLGSIELDRDTIAQKIRDGFEMRPTEAIVFFNDPSPGRKTYYRSNGHGGSEYGPAIREEGMTGPDFQRTLPLEEKKEPAPAEPHESFDPVPAPSKDVPPAGFALVTDGVSQEGDITWRPSIDYWEQVSAPGMSAGHYIALARPIGAAPAFTEETLQKDTAGTTPLGEALKAAAAGKPLPLVPVTLSKDFTADKARAQFRHVAKKQKWPEAAIDLLDDECLKVQDPQDEAGSIKRVLEILNAHTVQSAE